MRKTMYSNEIAIYVGPQILCSLPSSNVNPFDLLVPLTPWNEVGTVNTRLGGNLIDGQVPYLRSRRSYAIFP
jgi:hypothetical protein